MTPSTTCPITGFEATEEARQFNHITWTDAVDLREKLKNRIGAVLGDGPHMARAQR